MLSLARASALTLLLTLALGAANPASATSFTVDVEGDGLDALDAVVEGLGEFVTSSSGDVLHWSLDEPLALTNLLGFEIGRVDGWDVSLKEDPFVTNNINVTNTSAFTQVFIVSVIMPIPAFDYDRVVNSSVAVTATDSNGDNSLLVGEDGGFSFYRGRVDGVTLLPLSPPGLPLTTASCVPPNVAGCTTSTADGTPLMFVAPDTATELELILRFALSPGDSVGITSRFEIIPEPSTGALLALGLAALALRRRRARA